MHPATLKLGGLRPAQLRHMEIGRTGAGGPGPLAERAGVGTLVLSHLVPGAVDPVSGRTLHAKAQQGYSGRVVVGRDPVRPPIRRVRRG